MKIQNNILQKLHMLLKCINRIRNLKMIKYNKIKMNNQITKRYYKKYILVKSLIMLIKFSKINNRI